MDAQTTSVKTARKARTLDEEIAHQREKLRKLEERQREQQRQRPHAPCSLWRTVMTRIIPACMCSSMWQ